MKTLQLKNFKMNANIAGEISDLNLEKAQHIKSIHYPSILMMISENLLTGFEEFKVSKLTASYASPTVDLPPNIIIPVKNGSKCAIKFEDGTSFTLDYPVVVDGAPYEVIVPEGTELVLLSGAIDFSKSVSRFVSPEHRIETFARPML